MARKDFVPVRGWEEHPREGNSKHEGLEVRGWQGGT